MRSELAGLSVRGIDGYRLLVTAVDEFLARPLVAHVAASGPTVTPVWFLWEGGVFWWLTGAWSRLPARLQENPRVALVVDTCDVATGRVIQVSVRGNAEVVALDKPVAIRKLTKYLGSDMNNWPHERFVAPLDDPATALVRLQPERPPVLRDLSYNR